MLAKFLQSVHVPHMKNTALFVPKRMPAPDFVTIPMSMHIGAPAKPVVKVGDHVKVGQVIGEPGGFVSAPIHASVSGTVKKIEDILGSNGGYMQAITIESDGLMENYEGIQKPEITDFDSFIDAVRASGCVGLGGAGFPTSVKLKVDPDKVDYILVNGAECEPYITSDTHTMADNAYRIVYGLEAMRKFYPKAKIYIGVESNKPKSIAILKEKIAGISNAEVKTLPSSYPQGGEKVLIYNTTGRAVPEGKLPIDVGCIVINATTIALIGKYINTGMPLVAKCITIDGSAVNTPANIIAPIGTMIKDVVEFAGGCKSEPKKALYGGPMMGISMPDLNQPILKNTNAVILLNEKDAALPEPTPCIHCGRCVDACPMNLMPTELEHATIAKDVDRLKKLKIGLCMECGSCTFVCPAKRNLVESHKLAKIILREASAKK